MNKFEAGINRLLARFDARTMVEIDEHLDAVFFTIVIYHVANVIDAKCLDLTITHLNQYGCVELLGSTRHRD